MGNNYLVRLNKLQSKYFSSLQELQKEKISLEYLQDEKYNKPVLGFMTSNIPKGNTKNKLEKINAEILKIKNSIHELNELESFTGTIDDLKIVNYVDGHLDEDENKLFERLIKFDGALKKEIELMKTTNSFFGEFEDEFEDLDQSVLENWIEIEKNSKKNYEVLAKDTLKNKSLFSKIKDFITFRPLDLSFAAITPLFIGAGLLYGTNSTIVASNPAIIQLSSLSLDSQIYLKGIESTFPGSSIMNTRKGTQMLSDKELRDCSLPELKLDPKVFNEQFHIMVTNPKTKKTFKFSDNDKLLAENEIEFYFDYNKKGTIFIDNVISSKKALMKLEKTEKILCKTENILVSDYKVNTRSKIGDTFSIKPPWRKERIIIFFKDDKSEEKYPIGLLNYQPTTLEIFDKRLMSLEWEKKKNVQELERNGLYKLYSNVFKKTLYAPNIKSWKNIDKDQNSYNDVFIDFDGDNKAEIIAISNEENNIEYYIFDTNEDSKGDILVYPKIEEKVISYEWLIDANYDGFIDQIGYDQNGDWKVEKIKDM